jgi:YHS domain-containing protein
LEWSGLGIVVPYTLHPTPYTLSFEEVTFMAIDPVCKMQVDPAKAPAKSDYKGQTYYFCAPGCKREFDKNPEKYLKK